MRSRILDKYESKSKLDRGIIYVESIAFNQDGIDVLSFKRKVLIQIIIMGETYLMRSLMFEPAHNDRLLNSAVCRDADVLLLDIEDSVPYSEKEKSRDNMKKM